MTDIVSLTHYHDILRRVYGDEPWLIAMDTLDAALHTAAQLLELGASEVACVGGIAAGHSVEVPESMQGRAFSFASQGATIMQSIGHALRHLADLPEDIIAQIDALDPTRQMRVIGPIFDDGRPVAHRAKFGARPLPWQRLEDKLVVDDLWDELGVRRAPCEIVSLHDTTLLKEASSRLDHGQGVVWAGDFTAGFHGGADGVRWLQTPAHRTEIQAEFAMRFRQVRITPFLEGLPCSIHGVVFPETTIALHPCEMIVFRRPGHTRFAYSSVATFWDAQPQDTRELRHVAKLLGDTLRERVGYRGFFTIDGVMTREGFIPTEINPRLGAGVSVMTRGFETPLYALLLNAALTQGIGGPWRPEALEALILAHVHKVRDGSAMRITTQKVTQTQRFEFTYDASQGCYRLLPDAQPGQGDVRALVTPHPVGGLLRATFKDAPELRSHSLAPLALRALHAIEAHAGLVHEAWEAAPDVRASVAP